MRLTAALALAGACFACSAANADLLATETFTYPNGNLVGNGVWAAHSGAGVLPVQVTNGQAVVTQGVGSREDVNLPVAPAAAGSTYYAGFDLSNSGGSIATYFAHLQESGTVFTSRVFIVPSPTPGADYGLGLNSGSTTPTGSLVWPTGFRFGSVNRLVISYDFDSGIQRMWVNPVDINSPSIDVTGVTGEAIAGFALRQSTGNSTQLVDNVAVATSFGEVIPAPGSAALLLAGMSLLARRRRN